MLSLMNNLNFCRSFELIRWISRHFHFSGVDKERYLDIWWMKNRDDWVTSFSSGWLILSNRAWRRRVDNLSRGKSIDHNCRKSRLSFNFSSLNKSPHGSFLVSIYKYDCLNNSLCARFHHCLFAVVRYFHHESNGPFLISERQFGSCMPFERTKKVTSIPWKI
jgi:hypothetical protein